MKTKWKLVFFAATLGCSTSVVAAVNEKSIAYNGVKLISSLTQTDSTSKKQQGESKGMVQLGNGLKYETATGDFYNGKVLIAHLPFSCIDSLSAEKVKTRNGHVLYTVSNSYGEPHINDELYSVYTINGGIHTAKSFKRNINGSNSLIQDDKVILINQNVISIYDDITGKLLKKHTISTKPVKEYLKAKEYDKETLEAVYKDLSMGYMVEGAGDDFILYRNYELGKLILVDLKTDKETELYTKVYSESEKADVEAWMAEEGDGLEWIKSEKGVIYLKNRHTQKQYTYKY